MTSQSDPARMISFQGEPGANSDIACRFVHPEMTPLPCRTFEDAFAALREKRAELAMIPIENSVAGRVADIHSLMPNSGMHVIAEHYQRVEHCLVAPKNATLQSIKTVRSHVHALAQCRNIINELKLKAIVAADTAGAAREVSELNDSAVAAISSSLAAEIYGLQILKSNIEDADHNTTRFLIFSREAEQPALDSGPCMTAFVFRVRSVPAALYKALGGFATNGINITKLESYISGAAFEAAQFYAEIEGHPESRPVRLAFEELGFFSREVKVLGVFPTHPFRREGWKDSGKVGS
jgi:prephenate dehydratase